MQYDDVRQRPVLLYPEGALLLNAVNQDPGQFQYLSTYATWAVESKTPTPDDLERVKSVLELSVYQVPADDYNVWRFNVHCGRTLPPQINEEPQAGPDFRKFANRANDYLIDRELQKSGLSNTGIRGLGVQDIAVQESMGAIVDRTQEHLATSDAAIIAARRVLKRAAEGVQHNASPPGLRPETQRVRAISIVLPKEVPFQEGAGELLLAQPGTFFVST